MKKFIKENKLKKFLGVHRPSKMYDKRNSSDEETNKDEWIWVNGYKGTDKDMKCLDFQYEMYKMFEADGEIVECMNGFHLCTELGDVFHYYAPANGNRYFHVRALVRKKDLYMCDSIYNMSFIALNDKLVAKCIEFVSEVSREEFEHVLFNRNEYLLELPGHIISKIPDISVESAIRLYDLEKLTDAGYSTEFAEYFVEHHPGEVEEAIDLGHVKDISMDTKITILCCD